MILESFHRSNSHVFKAPISRTDRVWLVMSDTKRKLCLIQWYGGGEVVKWLYVHFYILCICNMLLFVWWITSEWLVSTHNNVHSWATMFPPCRYYWKHRCSIVYKCIQTCDGMVNVLCMMGNGCGHPTTKNEILDQFYLVHSRDQIF